MAPVCNVTTDSDVILGKLIYSSEHLDALICLIVSRLVNGKKLYIYIYIYIYIYNTWSNYKSIIWIFLIILQYLFHPDAHVKVDQGRLIIETEMVPLKYIKEKYQSNIVFLLRNLSCFHASLSSKPQPYSQHKKYTNPKSQTDYLEELTCSEILRNITLKDAFSITWMILGVFQNRVGKVN